MKATTSDQVVNPSSGYFPYHLVGLSGLGVTCLPRDPRFADSDPAEVHGIFEDVKIQSTSPPGRPLSWGSRVWDFRLVEKPQAWKNSLTSAGFEPANLGSRGKHVTPRPSRRLSLSDYWSWGRGFDSRHFHNFKCGLGQERGTPSFVWKIW